MRRSRLFLVLLLPLTTGCFSYRGEIDVAPASDAAAELSPQETERATAIVARVASEHGLTANSEVPEVARSPQSEAMLNERRLAAYSTKPQGPMIHMVVVTVLVHKQTGRFRVLVRDLDSLRGTKLTASVEGRLIAELSAAFPSHRVSIKRRSEGPALGP